MMAAGEVTYTYNPQCIEPEFVPDSAYPQSVDGPQEEWEGIYVPETTVGPSAESGPYAPEGYQEGDPSKKLKAITKTDAPPSPQKAESGQAQSDEIEAQAPGEVAPGSGMTVQQLFAEAEKANQRIQGIVTEYHLEESKLQKKYEEQLTPSSDAGTVKTKTERMSKIVHANPDYQKELADLNKTMLSELNHQKSVRDSLLMQAMAGMGYKGEKLETVHTDLTNVRGGFGENLQFGENEYDKRDLCEGILENCGWVEMGITKLKMLLVKPKNPQKAQT